MSEQLVVQQIFVYGTLMSSFDNPMAYLLDSNCQLVGKGTLSGKLYDTGDYPVALFEDDTDDAVIGEIHLIHPEKFQQVLNMLDKYLGYVENDEPHSLYLRNILPIADEQGHEVPCWVYTYNKSIDDFPLIKGGDYVDYLKSQGKSIF